MVKQLVTNYTDKIKGSFLEDQMDKLTVNDKVNQNKSCANKELTNESKLSGVNDSVPVIEFQKEGVNGTVNYRTGI